MIWYYAEDKYYYMDKQFREGKLILPSPDELKSVLREKGDVDVLATYLPPDDLKPLFTIRECPNRYGVFTTQDMDYLNSLPIEEREKAQSKLLEEKTGMKIYKVKNIKLEGLTNIKRYIQSIKKINDENLRPKGIFLVGLPGTGKSYSAKFASSVLDAYLVEMNLSKIIESANPVFTLHTIFRYLENTSINGTAYVIWIDEIEKMFVGDDKEKRVFGQLLTILNDINTPTGYKLNGIFWVTANNITDIMNRNPEFLRKGRFDEIFFIDAPLLEDAKRIITLYKNMYNVKYLNHKEPYRTIEEDIIYMAKDFVYSNIISQMGSKEADRFIYVPAEIQQILKQLAQRQYYNYDVIKNHRLADETFRLLFPPTTIPRIREYLNLRNIALKEDVLLHIKKIQTTRLSENHLVSDLDLIAVLSMTEPLMISMRESISKILSQEKLFTRGD